MTAKEPEKWIGIRQNDAGDTVAMFALPSGRIRSIKMSRVELLQTITEAARALKYSEPRR